MGGGRRGWRRGYGEQSRTGGACHTRQPRPGGRSESSGRATAVGLRNQKHLTPSPAPHPSGIASGAPPAGASTGAGAQDAGSALGAALLAALARQQHASRMAGVAAGPSLADVLRPDVVAPLLADEEVGGAGDHKRVPHCCFN
jgi:hypothetical protein